MQEENKFFRFVWRMDAILLALGGVGLIVLVGAILLGEILRWRYEPVPEGNFRPVPKDAEQNYTYRLEDQGETNPLPHEKMLALRRWNGSPASYGLAEERVWSPSSTYRYEDAVNLLSIDTATGESRWLFAGYKRRILSQAAVYSGGPQAGEPPAEPVGRPPIALVIRSADSDTNKDGEINSKDIQSLYFFRPNDTRAVKFFSANYILSTGETDRGDYLVVYEKGRSAFAATFHVPDFKLKALRQLPEVPR